MYYRRELDSIAAGYIETILKTAKVWVILYQKGLVFADLKSPIQGNFKYCDQGQGNLLKTENTCVTVPETSVENRFLDFQYNETKKFYLMDKMTHLVSGQATECKKEKIITKMYRDFF